MVLKHLKVLKSIQVKVPFSTKKWVDNQTTQNKKIFVWIWPNSSIYICLWYFTNLENITSGKIPNSHPFVFPHMIIWLDESHECTSTDTERQGCLLRIPPPRHMGHSQACRYLASEWWLKLSEYQSSDPLAVETTKDWCPMAPQKSKFLPTLGMLRSSICVICCIVSIMFGFGFSFNIAINMFHLTSMT